MQLHLLAAALIAAGVLTACNGSDPEPPQQPPSTMTLAGVVATGAALADAAVAAKCATGTGTATTDGSGSYTITITGGALPCVLEATASAAAGGTTLHSVAAAGATTANITPLTELLVAQLSGQDPAAYMAGVITGTLANEVTADAVVSAQTAVLDTLTAGGVDTSAVTDVVGGTLVAASAGTTGNGYDGVLDRLAAAITSAGTTLAELTTAVANTAAGSSGGSNPVPAGNPLPANLLLLAKASNCDALRSTRYRIVKIASSAETTDPSGFTAMETVNIDATTLTATFGDDSTMALQPNGACRYTLDDGDAMVSPAGVIVVRHMVGADDDTVGAADRGRYHMMIALPVQQALSTGDLAGAWNFIGMDRGTTIVPVGGALTISGSGVIGGIRCFEDLLSAPDASCSADTEPAPTLAAHADGGFTLTSGVTSDPWVDRVFTFKAGNGEMLLLLIGNSGEFLFGTRQRALPLPAVGDPGATNLTVLLDANLVAADAGQSTSHTIASVEAGTGTVVRNSAVTGSAVTHPQTLVYNSARTGYLVRNGGIVTASDGSSVSVRPFNALPLQGVGMTALYLPNTLTNGNSNARFGLSVRH